MLNSTGLGFIFTAQDLASGRIAHLEKTFTSLADRVGLGVAGLRANFQSLGVGLGIFAAGASLLGGAFAVANVAGAFEQKLAAIGATSQATAPQLRALHDAALEAGVATQFSPLEAAEGLLTLATAGQTAEQSVATLIPVLDLAAGALGQITVDQSADAVVGTLNAFGMAVEDAGAVTDKLLKTTLLTNFQAKDFEAGLAKAAATGAVFHQSLDDVLVTMGLLRNRNIDASSAATAYREAIRRVGSDAGAQAALGRAQVSAFDKQTGALRPLLDIMDDLSAATQAMTEEERNRVVVQAFGARGLLAFAAVERAQFTTTKDGADVTLQGRDAILALRTEMEKASGTAQSFREALLNTFEGQKKLLRGSLETLAVAIGEPFAQLLKPVVGAIVDAVNAVLNVVRGLPDGVKRAFAGFALAAGAALALVGAVIAAKAAIVLGAIALKVLGVSLGAIAAAVLPAIAAVALVVLAVHGLRVAFALDIGGFGTRLRMMAADAAFAWEGLMQLLSTGELSGAVQRDLNTLNNAPVKAFVVGAFGFLFRLQRIGEGIGSGFMAGIGELGPVFTQLGDALHALSDAFGALFGDLLSGANALPSDRLKAFGAVLGQAAAAVVGAIVRVVTIGTQIFAGLLQGWQGSLGPLRAAVGFVGDAFAELGVAWEALVGKSDGPSDAATSGWRTFGYVLGRVVGGAITLVVRLLEGLVLFLSGVLRLADGAKDLFVAFGESVFDLATAILEFFTKAIPDAIGSALNGAIALVAKVFGDGPSGLATPVRAVGDGRTGDGAPLPAVAEARGRFTELRTLTRERTIEQRAAAAPPIHVRLQVDGEVLARATADANVRAAQRSFVPLPGV